MPLFLMMVVAAILTGEGAMMLKDIGTILFSDLTTLIGLGISGWILYFFWKRIPRKLDEMGRKLNHRSDRIRRMEKHLRKAGVDCETPEELDEAKLRNKVIADMNVAWIRRTVQVIIIWQAIVCVLALLGSGNVLDLLLNMAALVVTLYFSKVANEETRLLEVTMMDQEKRIRGMEVKFQRNSIDINDTVE
jgi:hypothetical protein